MQRRCSGAVQHLRPDAPGLACDSAVESATRRQPTGVDCVKSHRLGVSALYSSPSDVLTISLAPTASATCRPSADPSSQENRKWNPAQTRASETCETAASNEVKLLSTPGTPDEVTVKLVSSPKNEARIVAAAELTPACAEGYSWKYGVTIRGCHEGSMPAIAVTGRQKL